MYNDFLQHHGILGQKWGVKNGPPYPIGSEGHSLSEKKAGWKKSIGGGRNEHLYNRKTNKKSSAVTLKSTTVPSSILLSERIPEGLLGLQPVNITARVRLHKIKALLLIA